MSTVTKPRQLSLDELRRLQWLLGGVMALVALWTVFFLDVEALGLVAVAMAAIGVTLVWPPLPGRVPPVVWTLAVPAIIAGAAADFYFSPDTLPVLIRLAILLVLYRTVAYRRKREDLQLIVLGLFLVVVAGVLTVSLGFAFLLLLFTACALGFLFVINLIDAAGAGTTRPPGAETAWTRLGWRPLFARLRAVADWRLLGFAAGLFAAVVVMSGLLFVVIPRFEFASGFFLDKYITRKSRTGFTESVKFGDVAELIRDESIALRVELSDPGSVREAPYWRLVVLDEYSPTGFRMSAGLKEDLRHFQGVARMLLDPHRGRIVGAKGGTWKVYVEPGVSRFLPLPGSYGLLQLTDFARLQTSAGDRLVALQSEPVAMTAFRLEDVDLTPLVSDPSFPRRLQEARAAPGRIGPPWTDPRLTLRGPAGSANELALRRVVGEITGGADLAPDEFARRAVTWLQQHHSYAMAVSLPPGAAEDDIVRWVDSNAPGFCEYFASGFAVLARAAGHPTRVIAGFHGGAFNGFENYYMVRNSDAHAWAEIYDGPRKAWVRVDPTPGSRTGAGGAGADGSDQRLDSSWSARLDSLRVLWYRRIVNFDSRTQVQMLEQVKNFTNDSGLVLRAKFEEFSRLVAGWVKRPWSLARVARAVGALAALTAAVWAFVRLARRGWARWRGRRRPAEFDPVRQAAGAWLGRLRRERGPRADAEETAASPPLRAVVGELQRLRYGPRETWPEPRGVFRRARQVRRTLRR